MAKIGANFLDDRLVNRAQRRWARAARQSHKTDLAVLRQQRVQAHLLKSHLDRLIHMADERLSLPMIGSVSFPRAHDSDWAWRPELWRGRLSKPGQAAIENQSTMGEEVTLFHDCKISELTMRQIRNLRQQDLAPYGLRLDVFKFDGSFLSLAIDLPSAALRGLKKKHIISLDAIIEMEHETKIFARLNIRHGPNTEQLTQELPTAQETAGAEFDLAYSNINEKRLERAWIDLIIDDPEMNQIVLRDLTFSRRPRAQM